MIRIDNPNGEGWCHMVADTIKELHEFAGRMIISKSYYQNKRGKNQPHYDIRNWKAEECLAFGAVRVKRKELFQFLKDTYSK